MKETFDVMRSGGEVPAGEGARATRTSRHTNQVSDRNVRPTRKKRARWVVVSGPVGKQHCKRAVSQAAEVLAVDFSGGGFRRAASPILAYCRIQGCWSEFSSGSKRVGRSGSSTGAGLSLRTFKLVR